MCRPILTPDCTPREEERRLAVSEPFDTDGRCWLGKRPVLVVVVLVPSIADARRSQLDLMHRETGKKFEIRKK